MNKNIKKLDDPLNEITLPNFSRLGINHHSPTQASMADGIYLFRYIMCTQEERRNFEGNANMAAGIAVNDALQWHYAKDIWKYNPLTKKLQPQKNEKLTQEAAIQKALDKFSDYIPVSDKDRDKFNHYKETIPQTIRNGFLACEQLGALKAKNISAEDSINFIDKRLQLPIVGRTDLIFQDFYGDEQSSSEVIHAPFLSVLEIKTVWDKPMKIRKDGSRSFSKAKLPSSPNKIHLQQLAFYAVSKSPCCPSLVYLSPNEFKIFTPKNCADLEKENLRNYYEQLVKICIRRERLLSRYSHLNDTDAIIKELIADTDPQFDHLFFWNIGHEFVKKAKELWSNIKR
mgnify:CR=1 FL=1|jgi:hypothetical protein